jgi:hypothetical protein
MGISKIYWFGIKKTFFYGMIGIPFQILVAFFQDSELFYMSTIIMYLYALGVLFHIGWSIKRKSARKKYIIYMSIVIFQMILLSVLGDIFGFKTSISSETENTILDAISVFIIFGTILWILIKIVRDSKKEFPEVQWLYFPIAIIVIALVATSVIFRFIHFVLLASIVFIAGILIIKKLRKANMNNNNVENVDIP